MQTSPDRVREMIHRFNDLGMRSLDPQWAGGRPRQIMTRDRELIVKTAKARPATLGCPFSHWSIRKLTEYLATKKGPRIRIRRERLRQILAAEGITFQRTKTWKESPDPLKEEKLARIEWCLEQARTRTFAFDEFGPLTIQPVGGISVGAQGPPGAVAGELPQAARVPAVVRLLLHWRGPPLGAGSKRSKAGSRRCGPCNRSGPFLDDSETIYVILDNLNHHRGQAIRDWCAANAVELVFTPTYASWANPIEAHFGPLRQFVLANSDHADHPALGRALRAYLRWRNTHTRDPELLEHQRRHRARIRSEQQRRWGHPKPRAA